MKEIRVHITDDHVVLRCGLKAFIEAQPGLCVVSEATYCVDTLEAIRMTKPDVAVIDINAQRCSTSQLARSLLDEQPKLGLLLLTVIKEEHFLRECLLSGVRGFLMKTSAGEDLIAAIHKLNRGESYVDPQLSSYLISNFIGQAQKPKLGVDRLTGREREVCQYLAAGYTNAEIAETLSISKRTVETHRAAIMAKVGLKNRAELVHFAMDNGLFSQVATSVN